MPQHLRPYIRNPRAIAAVQELMEIEGSDLNDIANRALIQYCEHMIAFYLQNGIGQSPPPIKPREVRQVRSPSPTPPPPPSNGSIAKPKALLEQVTQMSSDSFG